MHLFKHFPDTQIVRSDIADYYFKVQRWDRKVGSVLAQLEKHKLIDNTLIIISSDHGMPFPRGKGNLYDSGARVPFAVRWGNTIKAERKVDDFISLIDIAPTLLEIANIPIPKNMTGKSFLNILTSSKSGVIDSKNRADIVFGRERHVPAQEKPNMGGYPSRAYRNKDFLYIRNYEPDRWPAGTGALGRTNFRNQWYADCDAGPTKTTIIENKDKDKAHALAYSLAFAKRPSEELYDLNKDPDQLNNVAENQYYAKILKNMRKRLNDTLSRFNDPRAHDPHYTKFDEFPYAGGAGGAGGRYPTIKKQKAQHLRSTRVPAS